MASIKTWFALALTLVPSFALADEVVKVLPGETLMTFSNRIYGTHQKWRQILKWNKDIIKDPNRIEPGLELRVLDAGPKAEVAAKIAEPVKPTENRRQVAKARQLSSEGARVVYPVTERPAAVEKPVTRAERREVEETESPAERAEDHASPTESAHTPAGRAAIFPGIQHPDPDGAPLAPFSALEVPK